MGPDSGATASRRLLEERVEQAPEFVDRVPECYAELLERPVRLPRYLVCTGIGTSEGHARHLAEVAARWAGQPARFATTPSLAVGTPADAAEDWLVVFSQGLSANARYALRDIEAWGGVVLVTGLPRPGDSGFDDLEAEKRSWLEALALQGVVQLDLGCGAEYGALLRVIGARCGYAAGWSLLRALRTRQLRSTSMLQCDAQRLREAQRHARREVLRVFPDSQPVGPFFAADRSLLLVSEGGLLDLTEQLSLKIAEGLLRPQPRSVDVLNFAHGTLQSHVGRPTSILYLAGPKAEWIDRFRSTLDEGHQDLRVLRAELPMPFGVLEFEAMFDELVLRNLAEQPLDLVDWPGREREAALYAQGPDPSHTRPTAIEENVIPHEDFVATSLADRVWPEVEADLSRGCRTALIGLGSIEQHGPHLPLGTDHWIAEALTRGLAARIDGSTALPAIAFGCAREHLEFPGTLSIDEQTLEAVLVDLLASLSSHGYENVFVFSAHGGNTDALEAMRARLTARAGNLRLVIETDLAAVARMQADAVRAEGLDPEAAGPHAGEYETSLVATLRPGSVRRAALEPGRIAGADEAQGVFYPSLRKNAPDGVVGDPSWASADRGARYFAAWLDLLEARYRSAFSKGIEKKRQ